MWKSCRDHIIEDQGPLSAIDHTGSDESSPSTRITRYANVIAPLGEYLVFGPLDAQDAIIQWIIDDGVHGFTAEVVHQGA